MTRVRLSCLRLLSCWPGETADFDITVMDDGEIDGAQLLSILATAPEHAGAATLIEVLDDETPPKAYEPSPAHERFGVAVTG